MNRPTYNDRKDVPQCKERFHWGPVAEQGALVLNAEIWNQFPKAYDDAKAFLAKKHSYYGGTEWMLYQGELRNYLYSLVGEGNFVDDWEARFIVG